MSGRHGGPVFWPEFVHLLAPFGTARRYGCAYPEQARKFYAAVRGEKELVWADGNHFDYYDSPAQMDDDVANVARFFRRHLPEGCDTGCEDNGEASHRCGSGREAADARAARW